MRSGERVEAEKVLYIYFLIYSISVLFQSQKAKMNLAVELGFLLISWGGDSISRSFFFTYENLAAGFNSKLCEECSSHSWRVHTHIWNSGSYWIFSKFEVQKISMERRGEENPCHYFCYGYPKELRVFKAIVLVTLLVICSSTIFQNLPYIYWF